MSRAGSVGTIFNGHGRRAGAPAWPFDGRAGTQLLPNVTQGGRFRDATLALKFPLFPYFTSLDRTRRSCVEAVAKLRRGLWSSTTKFRRACAPRN